MDEVRSVYSARYQTLYRPDSAPGNSAMTPAVVLDPEPVGTVRTANARGPWRSQAQANVLRCAQVIGWSGYQSPVEPENSTSTPWICTAAAGHGISEYDSPETSVPVRVVADVDVRK